MATTARLDDPGALGDMLTGVSFIGGLATGLSLADAPSPSPAPTSTTSSGSSRATPGPSGSTWAANSSRRPPVRRGQAGARRRAGVVVGRAGPGRAAHRGPATAADDRFAGLGRRRCPGPVVLAVPKAAPVIPAGRFPTFIVLGISGARLARGAQAG